MVHAAGKSPNVNPAQRSSFVVGQQEVKSKMTSVPLPQSFPQVSKEAEERISKKIEKLKDEAEIQAKAEGWDKIGDVTGGFPLFVYAVQEVLQLEIDAFAGLEMGVQGVVGEQVEGNSTFKALHGINQLFEVGGILAGAFKLESKGLSLICKSRGLQLSKEALEAYKEENKDSVDPEVQKKIQEWNEAIELKTEGLAEKKLEFKKELTTEGIASVSKATSAYTALESIDKLQKTTQFSPLKIVQLSLGWIGDSFNLLFTGAAAKKQMKESVEIEAWREKCLSMIKEDFHQQTLEERKAQMEMKVGKLYPRFDISFTTEQIAPLRDDFDKLTTNATNFLDDFGLIINKSELRDLRNAFNDIGVFDSLMVEENDKLIHAFNRLEESMKSGDATSRMDASENLKNEFKLWKVEKQDVQFKYWFLRAHVDRQETLEHLAKPSLISMISEKHKVETAIHKFGLQSTQIKFIIAAVIITLTIAVAISAMFSLPAVGVLGLLLLIMTKASPVVSIVLGVAAYLIAKNYRTESYQLVYQLFFIKMEYTRLRASIASYHYYSKMKKVNELTKQLFTDPKITEEKWKEIELAKDKANEEFKQSEVKAQEWMAKLDNYQQQLTETYWKDFAESTPKWKVGKDTGEEVNTMDALKEVFEELRLEDFSDQTKDLFDTHLGVDFKTIDEEMKKNPSAIVEALKSFFTLEDYYYVSYIKNQNKKTSKKTI